MAAPAEIKLSLPFITRAKLFIHEWIRNRIFRSESNVNRRFYNLVNRFLTRPATTKLIGDGATRVTTTDIHIDPSRNLWFRLFVPHTSAAANRDPLPFIVYFHGGGFYLFGPDTFVFDAFCSDLAVRIPAVIASVNYRLSPENRYPSQYDDAVDALKFMNLNHHSVLPETADLENCFIAGDSAGANIAHHVTVASANHRHRREFEKLIIVGLLSLQPFFGGEERTESEIRLKSAPPLYAGVTDLMWSCFLPPGASRDHPASNVLKSTSVDDVKGFPAAVVVVGGWDPLQDWQRRYVEWLRNCGKQVELVEYPNAMHGFYGFPELTEYWQLIDMLKEFVHEKIRARTCNGACCPSSHDTHGLPSEVRGSNLAGDISELATKKIIEAKP